MMDPRDTPGYRLHRALSNLNSIDIEQLDSPDRERVVEATTLLEQVGLLTRPGTSRKQTPRPNPEERFRSNSTDLASLSIGSVGIL